MAVEQNELTPAEIKTAVVIQIAEIESAITELKKLIAALQI